MFCGAANLVQWKVRDLQPCGSFAPICVAPFITPGAWCDITQMPPNDSETAPHVFPQVNKPQAAPYVLSGHKGEVTGVAWCPVDFGEVRPFS